MKFYLNSNEKSVSPPYHTGCLVNIVIQPVCIHTVTMCSPCKKWLLCAVIVWIIILRHFNRKSFAQIPLYTPDPVSPWSYSGCPITKICLPFCAMIRYAPAFSDSARIISLSSARIFSIGTSVCLECGA